MPVVHPQMKLVTQFEFDASEAGPAPMRVTLVDDDGHELFGIGGTVTIQATHDGHPALLNQTSTCRSLRFLPLATTSSASTSTTKWRPKSRCSWRRPNSRRVNSRQHSAEKFQRKAAQRTAMGRSTSPARAAGIG